MFSTLVSSIAIITLNLLHSFSMKRFYKSGRKIASQRCANGKLKFYSCLRALCDWLYLNDHIADNPIRKSKVKFYLGGNVSLSFSEAGSPLSAWQVFIPPEMFLAENPLRRRARDA